MCLTKPYSQTKEFDGEIYGDVEIRSTKCGSLEVESNLYVRGISFEETARPREFLLQIYLLFHNVISYCDVGTSGREPGQGNLPSSPET